MTGWAGVITVFAKVFLAACLGQFIALGSDIFSMAGDDWKAVATAGIAAFAVTLYDWLNPANGRFGVGA